MRSFAILARAGAALAMLAFCGCDLPHDSRGATDRIRGGTIRVGVTNHPPWVVIGNDGSVHGFEATLCHRIADRLGARVQWVPGSESVLLESLQHGSLDVVAAGLRDDNPWKEYVALTRPHQQPKHGDRRGHVLAVQPGENRLLMIVEQTIDESRVELRETAHASVRP